MFLKINTLHVMISVLCLFVFHGGNCLGNEDEEIHLYAVVKKKPLFNGKNADTKFGEYLASEIVYPAEAQEKGISGRVYAEFVIETDGSVSNITIIRGVDPLLDNEVLRVVKSSSGNWTPGKHEGKPVRVLYKFPFVFRLNEQTAAMESSNTEKKAVTVVRALSEDDIFDITFVEEKPLFNGKNAEAEFGEFAASKIDYPIMAQEKRISGCVFAEFVIETDGSVSNEMISSGVDPLLDNEVLRIVKFSSGNWTPGKHEGKPVRVLYQIPFIFRLKEQMSALDSSKVEKKGVTVVGTISKEHFIALILDEITLVPDEKPLFNGKNPDDEFRRYVASQINYPPKAVKQGIAGRVEVRFIIREDGSITNVELINSVHYLLDREVLRVIKSSPSNWTPAKLNGKPVIEIYRFPFEFRLK